MDAWLSTIAHHAPHMNVSSVHPTAGWCSTYMQ